MTRVVPPGRVCCPNCFDFPWLKSLVAREAKGLGACSYCGARRVHVLPIEELEPYFQNFMAMFERDTGQPFTHGESLIDKFQFGWGVFADASDEGAQHALLEDILNRSWDDDDGEPPVSATDDYVSTGAPWHDSEHNKWTDFCSAVRDNQDTDLHLEEHVVEDLSTFAMEMAAGDVLYRARLGCERGEDREPRAYEGAAIGPPPVEKAAAGRANREGQVVLYCADKDSTAVAEVRPARGMLVSVCPIRLRKAARILDITRSRDFNPFTSANAQYELELLDLVEGFAEEMSRPLQRMDDLDHYIPCQRLCEHAASQGFAGLRYPSALAVGGANVVLFDPTIGEVQPSQLVEIRLTQVEFDVVQ